MRLDILSFWDLMETIERNMAREAMERARGQQIAAQGDSKAMKTYINGLWDVAFPGEKQPDDQAAFKAMHGRGI